MGKSIWHRAYSDTEDFRKNSKWWFWGVEIVGGGALFGIVGSLISGKLIISNVSAFWQNYHSLIGGGIGVIIGFLVIYALIFTWNLFRAPYRQRIEARHEFIKKHASYAETIVGNSQKQKYLAILDTLQALIEIENTVADSMFGSHKLTAKEYDTFREKLRQQVKIRLPRTSATYSSEDFTKLIYKGIEKSGLQIIGDEPNDNQIELMIKTRSILDDCGIGLSKGLENSNEYKELLRKFGEQMPTIDDKTPIWVFYCLALPSGINSTYLFWSYLTREYRRRFPIKIPMLCISVFKSRRTSSIKEMVQYIKNMIDEK